jgi:hypothetical protein
MIQPVSSWAATAQSDIADSPTLAELPFAGSSLHICQSRDSIWVIGNVSGTAVAFRAASALNSSYVNVKVRSVEGGVHITADTQLGQYRCNIGIPDPEQPVFRYTTTFRAELPISLPQGPRDIIPLTKSGLIQNTAGIVHTQQIGSRSGQMFFSLKRPRGGSVFYFQNLSALSEYCEDSQTSIGETVGGVWPEIGFRLPVNEEHPIEADKEYTINDAFVLLSDSIPENDYETASQFINYLAAVYKYLPKPETDYRDWPDISRKSLADLTSKPGCWTYAGGHPYLNAYFCDYKTPPEIMVQLAVLHAIYEYEQWTDDGLDVINTLMDGLPAFYDEDLKTISRWLPSMRDNLDESEEQKVPLVMDSWYLHHPLMNLAKLALQGRKQAEKLLLDSVDFAIRIAHHFKYEWPVFYKMDTLEVVKQETQPGEGGEKDVAGAYAYVMHLVYRLTGEERYLNEALRAAKALKRFGLDIFYQANNTAFSALVLLRLYKETRDEEYLNLSYLCLAGILRNVQLAECAYGNSKNFPTFFGVFPLNDAPYRAAYEELEVMMALNDYIKEAEEMSAPILDALRMLLPEFVRYSVNRLPFYYPTMLPNDILSEEIKTGALDPKLWIPIEDLYTGWQDNGQVGQEVYGGGVGFGIVPRQYRKIRGEDLMFYTDYPVINYRQSIDHLTCKVLGDTGLQCRVALVGKKANARTTLWIKQGRTYTEVKPSIRENRREYQIPGGSQIKAMWEDL